MTLAELLATVKRLNRGRRNHIVTADLFLSTLAKCSGGLCPTDKSRYTGDVFANRLKEAAQIPVYENDAMNFIAWQKSGLKAAEGQTLAPCAEFEAVYTSQKQDRDCDILEPIGCEVDPRMPVLWQHDPTLPIGAHREILTQDKSKILGKSAIADTVLGRDAAYLAEFGALRISHGFKPREFEPITQKSGGENVITGFHVLKYEMMEVSLVSVPSNTDAVLTAFSRGKLASPTAKSWGAALNDRRSKTFTTGWGTKAFKLPTGRTVVGIKRAAATGKAKALVSRKDAGDFEKALAEAAATIKHSGDYGLCFYKAGDSADTYAVWWTMGDADGSGGADETGDPLTSSDDVKSILGAVEGVASVEIGDEGNPPYDEGWREVYPEIRDWTSGDADKPQDAQPAQTSDPAPTGDDPKKGKPKKKGARPSKADAPVSGSAEHVAEVLTATAGQYLATNGVEVGDGESVAIEATFPDSVILVVGTGNEGDPNRFFRVAYSAGADGTPTFSGAPEPVELQTVANDKPADPAQPAAGAGGATDPNTPPPAPSPAGGGDPKRGKPVRKWVKLVPKGKLGKKDTGMLKEAAEHLEDAMSDGRKMPTVCKTLVRRACDLVSDVMKSDGSNQGDGNGSPAPTPTEPPTMDGNERRLWALALKMAANPGCSKTALAATLSELAGSLEKSDVNALLATIR